VEHQLNESRSRIEDLERRLSELVQAREHTESLLNEKNNEINSVRQQLEETRNELKANGNGEHVEHKHQNELVNFLIQTKTMIWI